MCNGPAQSQPHLSWAPCSRHDSNISHIRVGNLVVIHHFSRLPFYSMSEPQGRNKDIVVTQGLQASHLWWIANMSLWFYIVLFTSQLRRVQRQDQSPTRGRCDSSAIREHVLRTGEVVKSRRLKSRPAKASRKNSSTSVKTSFDIDLEKGLSQHFRLAGPGSRSQGNDKTKAPGMLCL
jgi:hypothetical protein